ncbi:uncharacterized protein KD926_008605 [Aspergillus affinis]|uniref:uncharacterized protein n=1 Tax=Aspergillus affinis TaxID=1070780 RepID=UPI0022FE23D9|nr:uncharacterized protein KD926_008605 [Aspergillus affinis]KAI9040042.1 hypothetical protein KD926_008605 [Aspergillus affinis]
MLKLKTDQFKDVQGTLSVYKATINLALGSANLRQRQVTKGTLDKYNAMILDTVGALNNHIGHVYDHLNNLRSQRTSSFNGQEELELMLKQKYRTKQCLYIYQKISESINRGRLAVQDGAYIAGNTSYAPITVNGNFNADKITANFPDKFLLGTIKTGAELERACQLIQDKPKQFPAHRIEEVDEVIAERCRRRNEKDMFTGCLSICDNATRRSEQARINVFEDIHAAEWAEQSDISVVGDLISAKKYHSKAAFRAGPGAGISSQVFELS